ncbi:MAG: hypothetical protein ABL958_06710 [Bdellovibrionia bacterium]
MGELRADEVAHVDTVVQIGTQQLVACSEGLDAVGERLRELGRLGFVSVFQSETYGPIHIDTKKTIEHDVVSQVQELEAPELQALDLAQTPMVSTGPAEPEPEAASDAEIDEAERQMELAEVVSQSENLADLLEGQPTEGEARAASMIETVNALDEAMRTSEPESAVAESEMQTEATAATEIETVTELAPDLLSANDHSEPGEPEPSPSI